MATRSRVQAVLLLSFAGNDDFRAAGSTLPVRTLRAAGPHLTEGWIEAQLDHFSAADNMTFPQKIAVYDGKWKGPGSPIFLRMPVVVEASGVTTGLEDAGRLIRSATHSVF